MRLFSRDINTAFPIVALAALAVLDIALSVVLGSTIISANARHDEAVSMEGERLAEARNEASLRAMERSLGDTIEERADVHAYFIGPEGVADYLQDIEDLGRHAGAEVEFSSVTPRPVGDEEVLHLSFTASGEFNEVFYMLMMLTSLPGTLVFERVFIEKTPDDISAADEAAWKMTCAVNLVSYDAGVTN